MYSRRFVGEFWVALVVNIPVRHIFSVWPLRRAYSILSDSPMPQCQQFSSPSTPKAELAMDRAYEKLSNRSKYVSK